MGIKKYVIAGIGGACLVAGMVGVCEFHGKYETYFDKVNGKNYLVVEGRADDRGRFYRAYFDKEHGKKCFTIEKNWDSYDERKEEERKGRESIEDVCDN